MRWRSRLIGVIAGLAVAVAIAGQRHQRPELPILPENEGALATIEVQYAPESPELTRCVASFLRQIEPDVEVIAACPDERACAQFRELAAGWGLHRFNTVNAGAPIQGWSQDRFLVTGSHPQALLTQRPEQAGCPSPTHDP